MQSHRFDPISAVLGLIALVASIMVMSGQTVPFDADLGPWLAVVALAFGVVLLPWGMRNGARTTFAETPGVTPDPNHAPDPTPDANPTPFA